MSQVFHAIAPEKTRAGWRIAVLALLALAEFSVIDTRDLSVSGLCSEFLFFAVQAVHFSLFFVAGMVIATLPRLKLLGRELCAAAHRHQWRPFLVIQLAVFGLFYFWSGWFFEILEACTVSWTGIAAWSLLATTTLVVLILCVADHRFWFAFARREWPPILLSALVAGLVTYGSLLTQGAWSQLAELTFQLSSWLLSTMLPGVDIISQPDTRELGTSWFIVNIAAECSGYEGIGLVVGFLTLYLGLFRQELRFPRALLLFPLGIVTIWVVNAVRIATLVAIGAFWSPAVAVGGFHSQAGWVAFTLVAVGLIVIIHNVPFFMRGEAPTRKAGTVDNSLASAMLVPFLVLLASTLLTGALSASFDWLYPLKVVATAAVLLWFWRCYCWTGYRPSIVSVAVGGAVFAFWMVLVPHDIDGDRAFSESLLGASPAVVTTWLLLRSIGSVITVPLAEELAFRGYLISRLCRREPAMNDRLPVNWFAIGLSSLAFGVLHGAWLAGSFAGLLYALARYWRGRVWDAVVAHMLTNALVTVYVLSTREWTYW